MTSILQPPAGREKFLFLGTEMTLLASSEGTGGALGLIEQVAPAGFAAPPHIHHAEDEAFYVVSGSIEFHRGDEAIKAGPGAFIWLPRDRPHWFTVGASGPAKLLQFNTPAGLEQFFAEMSSPAADAARLGSEPDPAKLFELAAKYHIELLPPAGH